MLEVVLLIVLLSFYILFIAHLVIKYRHITVHEEVYDRMMESEEYKKSEWYWPVKKEYGKTDAPDFSGMAGSGYVVAIMAWQYVSIMVVHTIRARVWGLKTPFSTYNGFQFFVLFAALILAFVLGEWITMFSKRPMALTHGITLFPKQRKSQACRKMTLIALVAFALLYPIRIAGFFNSGAFDEERVVYRAPFQAEAAEYKYSESELRSEDPAVLVNAHGEEFVLKRSLTTEEYDPIADIIIELYNNSKQQDTFINCSRSIACLFDIG